MEAFSDWTGPTIVTPPTTSESFTLDFKQYGESLGQPEFHVLLNNRWGLKVFPFKEVASARPLYVPSSYDVVTGRALDTLNPIPVPPPSTAGLETVGHYKSFSLVLQPIATRFELDEMCNLWDRDVIVSFDLHIGGQLLSPFLQGDFRGQIRSLNRQEVPITFRSGPIGAKTFEWLHVCPSSVLLDQKGFFARDDFRIIVRIDENRRRADTNLLYTQADAIRRETFGGHLLDPKHGDIIFRFPETAQQGIEGERMLFAASDLLIRFSPYFRRLFQGEFAESRPQSLEFQVKYDYDTNNIPALRSLIGSGNRKVITVNNARFTDYHNILYYIYTGTLNLRFNTQLPYKEGMYNDPSGRPISSRPDSGVGYGWEVIHNFPRQANPNEVYRLSGLMGLAELQTRAYHYLMSTCSVDNIFDRLFDPYCKSHTHAPVRNVYREFLARNWNDIRSSGQWGTLLRRYRSTQRDDEAEYLLEAICEILNAVTWDHKLDNFLPKH